MYDYNARHIIEALRSGVPSRAVGAYFSEARPQMMEKISGCLEDVRENGKSEGMIFKGRYGEGKTHLLNTVFNMASSANMVVSLVQLGKETPIDKPHLFYPKLIANTYLPGAMQPGFRKELEAMTQGSGAAGEMLAYTAKELDTDKLYYLLKAFLGTQDEDDRNAFLSDLEGDFVTNALVKKSFRRVTGKTAKFNQNFSKTRHAMDYFYFTSHLFRVLGYDGWVILLDEAELIGRLGRKTRLKTYCRMQDFLNPDPRLEKVFTLISFSSSYVEDVIDKRNDFASAEEVYSDSPEELKAASAVMNKIIQAPELAPLTAEEIHKILVSIEKFHGKAYGWNPDVSEDSISRAADSGGYLLRTKIRAAIEFFDQLYQYGEAGETKITELGQEVLDEEADVPDLTEIFSD